MKSMIETQYLKVKSCKPSSRQKDVEIYLMLKNIKKVSLLTNHRPSIIACYDQAKYYGIL